MENREKIITLFMEEILLNIFDMSYDKPNFKDYKYDLSHYIDFFSNEEIEKYKLKMDIMIYLENYSSKEKFINNNYDVIIYFLKDLRKYLLYLKNKKQKLILEIEEMYLDSLNDYKTFSQTVEKTEFIIEKFKYLFTEKEIKKFNDLWFQLEIENAILLSSTDINEEWRKNYKNILRKVKQMLSFLNILL